MTMTYLTKTCRKARNDNDKSDQDVPKGKRHAMTMTNLTKTCRKACNDNDKSDQDVPKGTQ